MQSPTDLVFGGYGPSNPKRKEESFDVGYWNPPCERSPMSPIPNVLEVPPPCSLSSKSCGTTSPKFHAITPWKS